MEQLKECKETISSLQQEKAILGLSAAQVYFGLFSIIYLSDDLYLINKM